MGLRNLLFVCLTAATSLLKGDVGPPGATQLPATVVVDSETIVFDVAPSTNFAVPIKLSALGGHALYAESAVGPTVALRSVSSPALRAAGAIDLVANGTQTGRIADPFDPTYSTYTKASAVRLPIYLATNTVVFAGDIELTVSCTAGDITLATGCFTDPNCFINRDYLIPHDPSPGDSYCRADLIGGSTCNATVQALCLKGY